jgi:branched-chain amino acid aminotransferase
MNIFFVMDDDTMVTPPLSGTILPGITRESLIQLAADRGITTEERPYSVDEWRADAATGRLTEAFACGTAAVVTPIGTVRGHTDAFVIGSGEGGPVGEGLRRELLDIQRGRVDDRHGWVHRVLEPARRCLDSGPRVGGAAAQSLCAPSSWWPPSPSGTNSSTSMTRPAAVIQRR